MKKSILLTTTVVAFTTCIVIAVIFIVKYNRENLVKNASFNLSLGSKGYGWKKLLPVTPDQIQVKTENGNSFAVIDTIGLTDEKRNPFSHHALGQGINISGKQKVFSLSGRVKKESKSGLALAHLRLHGTVSRSYSDSFRLEAPVGKWVNFSFTVVSKDPVSRVAVVLGFHGQGAACFDDLKLVIGTESGNELFDLAKYLGIILLAYICAFALLELTLPAIESKLEDETNSNKL